jgi:hypothetical protein
MDPRLYPRLHREWYVPIPRITSLLGSLLYWVHTLTLADQAGTFKVPLTSQKIVGVYSSRGSRMYQEDAAAVHALQIPPKEMQTTLKKIGVDWDPALAGNEFLAGQVAFFGIYDG